MKYERDKHHRHSIRLKGYDYSEAGAYFVTICTQGRECLFGDFDDGEIRVNDAGHHVRQCWNDVPAHFPHVELDEFVVMPNHVHGIIVITETVGIKKLSPVHSVSITCQFQSPSKTIGSIVRGFKIGVTKWFRQNRVGAKDFSPVQTEEFPPPHPVWQRNYYEHIIRDEKEMDRIREYIIENPAKWGEDEENPANCKGEKFFAPTIHTALKNRK